MPGADNVSPRWLKSSTSDPNNCVEVRFVKDAVEVRDSKNPDGPILTFTNSEWAAFLAGVRRDEFDRSDEL